MSEIENQKALDAGASRYDVVDVTTITWAQHLETTARLGTPVEPPF